MVRRQRGESYTDLSMRQAYSQFVRPPLDSGRDDRVFAGRRDEDRERCEES